MVDEVNVEKRRTHKEGGQMEIPASPVHAQSDVNKNMNEKDNVYDELERVAVEAFQHDEISKQIEHVYSNISGEKPFDAKQNEDAALALPDSVMLRIFSNLSHPELCSIALVCKHWLWVVYDSELWKYLDLSHSNKVEEKQIISLIQRRLSPLLNSVDLSNCSFSPVVLNELTDHCEQLNTLVLRNSSLKNEDNMLDTLSIPDNLVRLDIRNFNAGFRFMHIILEAEDMSNLECFGFGNQQFCPAFTDFQMIFSKMHSLRILECVDCEFVGDPQIQTFADKLKNLESLNLQKCTNINGESLVYLIQHAKHLKSLNLSGTGITDVPLASVEWEKSIIEEIDLSFCDLVTSEGLVNSISRMMNLEHIVLNNISRGKAVTGNVLEASVKHWKNLKIFSLHFSNRLPGEAFSFMQQCTNLRRLSLRTCYHVTFACVARSLKYFPLLTGLECGSMFVSDETHGQWKILLKSIGDSCKQMKDVVLVKCLGLPLSKVKEYGNEVGMAIEQCRNLQNLSILYSEEAILRLIESRVSLSSLSHQIHVTTSVNFKIIPVFKNSLDSEIKKDKFKKFFGY